MRRYSFLSGAVFIVIISALVGGVYGRSLLETQNRLSRSLRIFTSALAAVQDNYVEELESELLVYGAVRGVVQTLDPHSSFMDPKSYAQLRERQEGRYYGLGITITVINGDITVVALFEGSPAYRQGIRRGDVIARIEGESASDFTSDQAVKVLRGPRGSSVKISIRRQGYEELVELEVERDEIQIPTILGSFMLEDSTAYIRLRDFSETTDRDLYDELKKLSEQGMQRLLLDLRDNPGGPLDQAIRVANRFLERGDLIVYTRGRVQNADQDYRATKKSEFSDLLLIVLVNRNSASASEIVAGAIQDHDRGLIVGETTFGKALVQSIYRISHGAGLALTTARYYTPSGRLIQRPWDGTFDEYLTYSLRDQSDELPRSNEQLKYTDAGRKVFGGGGIQPDHPKTGPIEGFNPTKFGRLLYARQLFATYAQKFSIENDTRFGMDATDRELLDQDFIVDTDMVKDFFDFVRSQRVKIDVQLAKEDDVFIRTMIRYDIDLALFGVKEARRRMIAEDPQAKFALSLFSEAEKLTKKVAEGLGSPVGVN